MGDRLTATYIVSCAERDIAARADAIASEQSVECPLEAIGEQRILDEIVARVTVDRTGRPGRFRVDVAIAAQTIGTNPVQFNNMVFGNASLWDDVQFAGPRRAGRACWRCFPVRATALPASAASLGVPDVPLTNAAMKPQGLHVPELAAMCRTFALAGVDIIKDDHGIDDQHYSPFAERVRACQAAIAEAVARDRQDLRSMRRTSSARRACCANVRALRGKKACARCWSRRCWSACRRSSN